MEVEYVDCEHPEAKRQFADLLALAQDRNLSFPLVAINGRLKLAGSAQYLHVLPLVEEAMAANRQDS
ncbi:MAG: hypothetical protein ACUVWZ_11185 [Anaerolineae bacterium]